MESRLLILVVFLAAGVSGDDRELREALSRLQARVDAQEREITALRAQLTPPPGAGGDARAAGGGTCKTAPFAWPCAPSAESRTPARPFQQFDRVMMVTAHPDDKSIGSGTLARFARPARYLRLRRG